MAWTFCGFLGFVTIVVLVCVVVCLLIVGFGGHCLFCLWCFPFWVFILIPAACGSCCMIYHVTREPSNNVAFPILGF